MNIIGKGKNKKKEGKEAKPQTWKEMKEAADKEEGDLSMELENLKTWVDMVQTMSKKELKEYLKNRPDDLKAKPSQKNQKSQKNQTNQKSQKNQPNQKSQKSKAKDQGKGKAKSSAYSGILASVMKFHKED